MREKAWIFDRIIRAFGALLRAPFYAAIVVAGLAVTAMRFAFFLLILDPLYYLRGGTMPERTPASELWDQTLGR